MKIILTQDVKNLGHKDDVVVVKDGYARNFLIPTGKAKLASEGAMKMLAEDMRQRAFKMDKLRKDGVRENAWSISRFKGLGEMNAEQLWETTLNPDTRRLLPVQLGGMDFAATENLIAQLMGKGEAAARRELMEIHGDSIEIDV